MDRPNTALMATTIRLGRDSFTDEKLNFFIKATAERPVLWLAGGLREHRHLHGARPTKI